MLPAFGIDETIAIRQSEHGHWMMKSWSSSRGTLTKMIKPWCLENYVDQQDPQQFNDRTLIFRWVRKLSLKGDAAVTLKVHKVSSAMIHGERTLTFSSTQFKSAELCWEAMRFQAKLRDGLVQGLYLCKWAIGGPIQWTLRTAGAPWKEW